MNDLTWVYVVTNPSFPKYVKVGWTRHNPHKRISDIDSTGVPTPFDLSYVACVEDAARLERLTHQFLDAYRVRSSREFFEVSARFAREAIRSVALNSNVRLYFEKVYAEDERGMPDAPAASIYDELDDVEEVHSAYASLASKAFLDYDINRAMNILLDYCKWCEGFPEVDDVFTDEEIGRYRNGILNRVELYPDSLNLAVSDHFIDEFLKVAVDEDSVRNLIDWVVLILIPDAQALRIARYYISYGLTSRIKLLAANYLYEIGSDVDAEVLGVYIAELKVDVSIFREPSGYIAFNQIINQAFVRMCNILMKSNCHEYDCFLRRFLDLLESSQSCFVRHYPGLRTVMECYFDGKYFEGGAAAPLISFILEPPFAKQKARPDSNFSLQ